MIHAREDYNRIQDPALTQPELLTPGATPIREDEPVILFRAQDKHFIKVLNAYNEMISNDPEMEEDQYQRMSKCLDDHVFRARAWQHLNGRKSPDL